jgi:hypothetical protein
MDNDMKLPDLTLEQRQAIFRSVIDSQDAGASVAQSRIDTAKLHSVTVEVVKSVEQEGIQNQWPPL